MTSRSTVPPSPLQELRYEIERAGLAKPESHLLISIQTHLTLLRLFVAVYDTFQNHFSLTALLSGRISAPELQEAQLNHFLRIADFRYRLYLELLVSVSNTPKETWPLPQWYNPGSAY